MKLTAIDTRNVPITVYMYVGIDTTGNKSRLSDTALHIATSTNIPANIPKTIPMHVSQIFCFCKIPLIFDDENPKTLRVATSLVFSTKERTPRL